MSGSYDGGIFTITGRPQASGVSNYAVIATGGCNGTAALGNITVLSDATIGLTSTNNNEQTVCRNIAISDIVYRTGGSATGATANDLPDGIEGVFDGNSLRINGVPTEAGVFNYTVSTTGLCEPVILNGIITVQADPEIVQTSVNNNQQTVCKGAAITNITYDVGGSASGGNVDRLPPGVTSLFDGNRLTISGTPTVAGTFNFEASTTGSCSAVSLMGTITVTDNAIVTLMSDNSNQGGCINEGITPIVFLIGGSGTGGSVSDLPPGINWFYENNTITISGTPIESGVFEFRTSAKGSCIEETEVGTIRVASDPTISLSSLSNDQTVCLNSPLQSITYSIGGSGSGGEVSGLPDGLTGGYSNSVISIQGTPTETGTFNYTARATSSCGEAQETGTITVSPNATISLNTANSDQTVCIGSPITNIGYSISGSATGGSVKDLPSGVQGIYSNNLITISGTPTESGVFTYSAVTVGACSEVITTGTITVNSNATINLTSLNVDQVVCINTAIENISFSLGGTVDGASVLDLPSGVQGILNDNTFEISGMPTVSGNYDYTVRASSECADAVASGTLTVRQDASIILTSSNDLQTTCVNSSISDITYSVNGTVTDVTVIGLPSGLISGYNNGVLTISGTPTGAGSFNYTATAIGPCANGITTGTLNISTLPTAKISGTQVVCQFDENPEIVFEGALGIAPYTFTYSVNSGAEQTITTTTTNDISIPISTEQEGVFTYSLLRVEDSGTSNCGQSQSGSATVVVNSLPTATINGSTKICKGSDSPIVTFVGDDGRSPYTFHYAINDGELLSVTSLTGDIVTVEVPTDVSGSFIYQLVSVRDASDTQCERNQSGTVNIIVQDLPHAEISGSSAVCFNDAPGEITFTGSEGIAPYTFRYTINNGNVNNISTSQGNSITIQVPTNEVGTFEYDLVSVQDDSDLNCEKFVSGKASVVVKRLPLAAISGSTEVCIGDDSPEITFTGSNGISPYTFHYTLNGGAEQSVSTVNGNSVNIQVSTAVASESLYELVRIEDSDEYSCQNKQEGNVNIIVSEIPNAIVREGGNNCGLRFMLNATPSVGNGTWTMTNGTGNIVFNPDANTPDAEVIVDEYGTYEFTWTEVNGSCSDNASVSVNFLEGISAFAGDDQIVCNLGAELNAQTEGNGVWTLHEGPGDVVFNPNRNNPNASATVSEYGVYQFEWTEINHVCQSKDVVEIIFREQPALNVGNDSRICVGNEVQLEATGDGTFLWEPSESLDDPNINNPIATPEEETTFLVTLTDIYGCKSEGDIVVSVVEIPNVEIGENQILEYEFSFNLGAPELLDDEIGKWEIVEGAGEFGDELNPITIVSELPFGESIIKWTVTNGVCPEASDYISIIVKDLIIPNVITPNNDEKNERFIINGITTLGISEIVIFDRRGLQVYRNSDYDNSWNGVDQSGNDLPDDTYYYTLKPTYGKVISGYIVVKR